MNGKTDAGLMWEIFRMVRSFLLDHAVNIKKLWSMSSCMPLDFIMNSHALIEMTMLRFGGMKSLMVSGRDRKDTRKIWHLSNLSCPLWILTTSDDFS